MTAKAARDTIVTVTRVEAPCGTALGCLSACVSLSGVSATCVPTLSPVATVPPAANQQKKKSHRVDDPAITPPRSPTLIRLKSWAIMVNDRLFPAVRRSTAGCPAAIAPSAVRIGTRGGAPLASVPLARARRRCEPIHILDRRSCASLHVRGRPDSLVSRWRLIDQATQFHLSCQRHEHWRALACAASVTSATGSRREICLLLLPTTQ
jgi:hypothetical protein